MGLHRPQAKPSRLASHAPPAPCDGAPSAGARRPIGAAAVLMYLRKITSIDKEANATKRCLIMSDCSSARQMIEEAWRAGSARGIERTERRLLLEAICRYRRQLGLVVIMGIRSHLGVSASSYADAAAKACIQFGPGAAAVAQGKGPN